MALYSRAVDPTRRIRLMTALVAMEEGRPVEWGEGVVRTRVRTLYLAAP